jgi:hypothetical protein
MFAVLTDSKTLSKRNAAVARVPSLLLSGPPLCVGEITLGAVVFILDPAALPPVVLFDSELFIRETAPKVTRLGTHCGAVFSESSC